MKNNNKVNKEAFYERWKTLGNVNIPNSENSNNSSNLLYHTKSANGRIYGIVKENSNFFIKTSTSKNSKLDESDFAYVNGLQNKTDNKYNSFSEALKQLNFKVLSINEALGVTGNNILNEAWINESDEDTMAEVKKLKEANEDQSQEEPAAETTEQPQEQPAETNDTDNTNNSTGEEAPAEKETQEQPAAETDNDAETTDDQDKDQTSEIQSVLGKLTQKISANKISPKFTKTIINSIISSLDLKELDDNERAKISKRIKLGGAKLEEDFDADDINLEDRGTETIDSDADTEFGTYMKDENVDESDPDDLALAIIGWGTQFALGNNNGDFKTVAKYITPEIWDKIKDEATPKFIQDLKSKLKGKVTENNTYESEIVAKGGEEAKTDNNEAEPKKSPEIVAKGGEKVVEAKKEMVVKGEEKSKENDDTKKDTSKDDKKILVDEDFDITDASDEDDKSPSIGNEESPAIDTALPVTGANSKDIKIDLKNQTIDVKMTESEIKLRRVIKKLIESEIKDVKILDSTLTEGEKKLRQLIRKSLNK